MKKTVSEQQETIARAIQTAVDKRVDSVGRKFKSWKDWTKKQEQISYEETKAHCQRVLDQITDSSMLVVLQHTDELANAFTNKFAFGDYDTSPYSSPFVLALPLDINDPKVYEIKKFYPTAKIVWYKTALENYIKSIDAEHNTFVGVSKYLDVSTDLSFRQEAK